ncbi:MAG TPA: transporter substrate-binding domain-containing protein [Thermotogota bacterium]|nr:transporter substrate-binding domain-containing protein [Thermotogota bacterium]HPR96571.1 transporter substrate-binding domain-containing protein [Thermotogota bacterium]
MKKTLILMTILLFSLLIESFGGEKMIIGSEENYYPFSYMTNSLVAKGFNFELTNAIAKVVDLDVEFVYKPFSELKAMLENEEIDAIVGMYFSEERQKQFDFTQYFMIVNHSIFRNSGMPEVDSIKNLKDKKVIVMKSDIAHDYLIENAITEDITTVRTEKEALLLMSEGFEGYTILAEYPGLYWLKELNAGNISLTGDKLFSSKYCYAVKKGNSEPLGKLNEGLSIVMNNGAFDDIYKDWMGRYILSDECYQKDPLETLLIWIIPVIIIIPVFIFFLLFLRRKIRNRTDELTGEIKEREKAERLLEEQNRHLNSILDNSINYGIYRTQTDKSYSKTDVVLVSPSIVDITGINEEDLHHFEKWFDFIYPEDLPRVIEANQRGYFAPFRFNEVFRVVHREKGIRWLSISSNGIPFEDDPEKIEYANGMIIDITEQKKAENELLESRERFKALFDNSMNAILISDDEGNYTSVNPAAVELFGYSCEEFETMNVSDIKNASLYTPYKNYHEHLKEGKSSGELFFIDKYGNKKIANYHSVRIMKNFTVTIMTEITERVKNEMELKEALNLAENANKAKSEFLANMSHEIRTPMNGIIGFSEILLNQDLDEQEKKYVEYILTSARNLLFIINDILDFSKIESGSVQIEMQKTEIRRIVYDVVNLLKAYNKNENVQLIESIDEDIPEFILTDSVKLNQILSNLLSNALKFTESGEVHINLRLIEDLENTCQIKFEVTDTGIGIEKKKLKEIMKAFTQADSTITRKYGGTGLGLSITNSLVELMNGQLDVFSEMGRGSSFSFILEFEKCMIQEKERSTGDENTGSLSTDKEYLFLIAEDNIINRALARTLISNFYPNSRVVEAEDGRACVELYKKSNPDIILMDLHMPKLDGIKAARMIRIVENGKKRVPIIGLTADIKPEKRKLALENGMDELLTKPLEIESLNQFISKYLHT